MSTVVFIITRSSWGINVQTFLTKSLSQRQTSCNCCCQWCIFIVLVFGSFKTYNIMRYTVDKHSSKYEGYQDKEIFLFLHENLNWGYSKKASMYEKTMFEILWHLLQYYSNAHTVRLQNEHKKSIFFSTLLKESTIYYYSITSPTKLSMTFFNPCLAE